MEIGIDLLIESSSLKKARGEKLSTHQVIISLNQTSIPFGISNSDFLPIVLVIIGITIGGIAIITLKKEEKLIHNSQVCFFIKFQESDLILYKSSI